MLSLCQQSTHNPCVTYTNIEMAYPGAPSSLSDQNGTFISYYRDIREDDLGRSAVQHKPLNKGVHAQASLAKSFVDTEPSMGPRVFCPASVHKPHTPLTTQDIEGCKPRRQDVFPRARGTDPNEPVYQLASCSVPAEEPLPAGRATRHINDVRDIPGTTSRPMPAFQPQTQNLCLDVTDIDGTFASWKPQFRALGNGVSTDKRFDSSDINTTARRPPQPRRPDDPWVAGSTTNIVGTKPRPASAYPSSRAIPAATASQPEYTGLPYFQIPRKAKQDDSASREHQQHVDAAELSNPGPHHTPTDALAADMQHSITHLNTQVATARRQQQLLRTDVAHAIRVAISDEAVQARKLATATVNSLQVSRAQVEDLWNALRKTDREGSGKVQLAELGAAFTTAGVQVLPEQLQGLAYGLKDGVGLLSYADFVKTLLWRSKHTSQPAQGAMPTPRPFSAVANLSSSRRSTTATKSPLPGSSSTEVPPPIEATSAVQQQAYHQPVQLLTESEAKPPNSTTSEFVANRNPAVPQVLQPRPVDGFDNAAMEPVIGSTHGASQAADTTIYTTPLEDHSSVQQQQQEAMPRAALCTRPPSASGKPPTGLALLGPEGAKYYIYKGKTYWFGGNDTTQELAAAAEVYKPTADQSYNATLRNISRGLGDGGPLTQPTDHPIPIHSIRDMPTTASLLKTGKLSGQQLSTQLDMKHMRTQSTEQTLRARPASAAVARQPMIPAPQSGASLGASLRSVVGGGVGTGKQAPDLGQLSGWPPRTRPISAHPAGRPTAAVRAEAKPVVTSFTSIANAGPGAKTMGRHDRALLRDEIQSIRLLS